MESCFLWDSFWSSASGQKTNIDMLKSECRKLCLTKKLILESKWRATSIRQCSTVSPSSKVFRAMALTGENQHSTPIIEHVRSCLAERRAATSHIFFGVIRRSTHLSRVWSWKIRCSSYNEKIQHVITSNPASTTSFPFSLIIQLQVRGMKIGSDTTGSERSQPVHQTI